MQKNVVIQLHIGNATGRNILAGVLKRIKDRDGCTIRIACGNDDFRRLSGFASAVIADASADIEILQSTIASGKPVVLLNDWRFKEQPPISAYRAHCWISDSGRWSPEQSENSLRKDGSRFSRQCCKNPKSPQCA